MTVLKSQDMDSLDGLLSLLGSVSGHSETPVWLWAAGPDGWSFDFWPGSTGQSRWYAAHRLPQLQSVAEFLRRTSEGRLFAPSGELRWRKLPGSKGPVWRMVFLGDSDWFPDQLTDRQEIEQLRLSPELTSYYLWGQRTGAEDGGEMPEWIELSVPHRFQWPVPEHEAGSSRIMLRVERWTDPAGRMYFERFCELQPEQDR